ncbi:T9SS type A sorting domain-containing protein [Rapidithrix thailandica]|uniref:T9SS type A sorting domain-containing protein n=1 Tax=Rapidithrix thailandica TaxID=413964 RepID=A0AAW9SBJ4_9BACT
MNKLAAYFLRCVVFVFFFNFFHPVTAQYWEEVAKVLPRPYAHPNFLQEFGYAVAIHGNTAIVGAPKDEISGWENGSAYIFEFRDSSWQKVARLMPDAPNKPYHDPGNFRHFGQEVAISESLILVSSAYEIHAFFKPDSGWVDMLPNLQILFTPDEGRRNLALSEDMIVIGDFVYTKSKYSNDWAGSLGDPGTYLSTSTGVELTTTVAIHSDQTIAIRGVDNLIYVFEKPEDGWAYMMTETAVLTPSDPVENMPFGTSIAMDEETIVVGAPQDSVAGNAEQGALYVFSKSDTTWVNMTETARLTCSDGASYGHFGSWVSLDKDRILSKQNNAFYTFTKPTGGWISSTETKRLAVPDSLFNENISEICAYGETILMGVPTKTVNGHENLGLVHVLGFQENGMDTSVTVTQVYPEETIWGNLKEYFGSAIDIDQNTAVLAQHGMNKGADLGQVFIYEFENAAWTQVATLTASVTDSLDIFGVEVAVKGDVVLVSGTYEKKQVVYLFEKPDSGWVDMHETALLSSSLPPGEEDRFGSELAMSDDLIVVGDWGKYLDFPEQGIVYLYEKPAGGWVSAQETAVLKASNGHQWESFGNSVAVEEESVFVGALGHSYSDTYYTNVGCVYVFQKPEGGWTNITETAILSPSYRDVGSYFGADIAVSGGILVAGAPGVDTWDDDSYPFGGPNGGALYLYEKPVSGWVNMTETAFLKAVGPYEDDYLGGYVAIEGDFVFGMASTSFHRYGNGRGELQYFIKPQGGWSGTVESVSTIIASDAKIENYFGTSVALSGDKMVAGAPGNFGNSSKSGAVYFFQAKPAEIWDIRPYFANQSNKAGDVISIQLQFSQPVEVQNPQVPPKLLLETGETDRFAIYKENNGTDRFVFEYTVQAGDYAKWLDYKSEEALVISDNAGIISANGLPARLTLPAPGTENSLSNRQILVDAIPPQFASVSEEDDGYYKPGDFLTIKVDMNEAELLLTTDLSSVDHDLNTAAEFADLGNGWYELTVGPLDAGGNMQEGTFQISVKAMDIVGNISHDSSLMVITDKTSPSVQLYPPKYEPVTNVPFLVMAYFSEPVYGLEPSDFTVQNGQVNQLKGSDQKYKVYVTPQANGQVQVQLPHNVVQDRAGMANRESNLIEVIYQGQGSVLGTTKFVDTPKVFPNPAIQSLHIGISEAQALPASLKVYHANGKLVWEETLTKKHSTIPVHQLTKGVYILQIANAQDRVVRRFVKQ